MQWLLLTSTSAQLSATRVQSDTPKDEVKKVIRV